MRRNVWYSFLIRGLLLIILLILLLLSFFGTCHLTDDAREHTWFVRNPLMLNILLPLFLFLILSLFLSALKPFLERVEQDQLLYSKCKIVMLGVIFTMSLFWVVSTRCIPRADQYAYLRAADLMQKNTYAMFRSTNMLGHHHHMLGWTLINYALGFIIGSYNYPVLQFLNCIGITLIYRELCMISSRLGMKRSVELIILLFGILYYPFLMYSSFIYGTIPGLLFALLAFREELEFFRSGKIRDLLFFMLFLIFALVIKSNYAVLAIAMGIHAVLEFISKAKVSRLIIPLILVFSFLVSAKVPLFIARSVTGEPLDQGVSSFAYIAMGLRNDSGRAPGWYDGYVITTYKDAGYQTDFQRETAKSDILASLTDFSRDPEKAMLFFLRKIASGWNNPDFQAYWDVQMMESNIEQPSFIWSFLSRHGAGNASACLKLLQQLVLLGAVILILFPQNVPSLSPHTLDHHNTWWLGVTVIGGFIFHLFWEMKAQYTIVYFVLLIPYAASGLLCFSGLSAADQDYSANRYGGILLKLFPGVILAVLVCLIKVSGKDLELFPDNESYQRWIDSAYYETVIPDGLYVLDSYDGNHQMKMTLDYYKGCVRMRDLRSRLYLSTEERADGYHATWQDSKTGEDQSPQLWQLEKAEDGNYYVHSVLAEDMVLTYEREANSLNLQEYRGEKEQKWMLKRE